MPSRIVVQFRGIIRAEHLITGDVIKVGGDADCHICVEGQPGYLFLLRFDGGRYTVFNRSGHGLNLESQKLETNGSGVWQNGEDLCVDEDLVLTLRIDGNPEPIYQDIANMDAVTLANIESDEPDEVVMSIDEQDETAKTPISSTLLQIGVIMACLFAFGILIYLDQTGTADVGPRDEAAVEMEFTTCISGIQQEINEFPAVSETLRAIRADLQEARIQELRPGHKSTALGLYRRLWLRLSEYRSKDSGEFIDCPASKVAKQVSKFSEKQSEVLQSNLRYGN